MGILIGLTRRPGAPLPSSPVGIPCFVKAEWALYTCIVVSIRKSNLLCSLTPPNATFHHIPTPHCDLSSRSGEYAAIFTHLCILCASSPADRQHHDTPRAADAAPQGITTYGVESTLFVLFPIFMNINHISPNTYEYI